MFETLEDSKRSCFCHLLSSLSQFKVARSSLEVLILANKSSRTSLICKILSELETPPADLPNRNAIIKMQKNLSITKHIKRVKNDKILLYAKHQCILK